MNKNDFAYELSKLDKPVDRTECPTTPSTGTAYYNPPLDYFVFQAGSLQYPYFNFIADDAIIYGCIGMVIGHEMIHAFDDHGAQFDKDGNVKNWWPKEGKRKFKERMMQII